MITATVEHPPWPRRRWVLVVLALMGSQLAFIFWLSSIKQAPPQPVAYGPKVYLATGSREEMAGVSDPTLFVLANQRGFSGLAWLKVPPLEYDLPKWSDEEIRPFQLPVEQLGSEAGEFLRTNMPGAFELASKPWPIFDTSPPPVETGNPHSFLTIEGELASRPLLSQLKLDSRPDNDILSNSVVSVAVDVYGNVFSAVLLTPSGLKTDANAQNADSNALQLASSARFQPLAPAGRVRSPTPSARLQWGNLVFHWHTIPGTNTAPTLP